MNDRISKIFLLIFLILYLITTVFQAYLLTDDYNPHFDLPGSSASPPDAPSIGGDFTWVWYGARNYVDRDSLYSKGRKKAVNLHANKYNLPPLMAVLYTPFAYVDSALAYKIYIFVVIAAWGAITYALSQYFRLGVIDYTIFVALFLFSCPFTFDLEKGNYHTLTAALTMCGIVALKKFRSTFSAAVFLSIASLIKVYPVVLPAVLLLLGEYIFFGWFVSISLLLFLLSGGVPAWTTFYQIMVKYNFGLIVENPVIPSTVSALMQLFGEQNRDIAILCSYAVNFLCIVLISAMAITTSVKKLGRLSQAILISATLIVSRFIPSLAFIYGLTYFPFVLFTIRDALNNQRESHYRWVPYFVLLISAFVLLPPVGWMVPPGRFNFIDGLHILPYIQQLWFPLFTLLFTLCIFWYKSLHKGVDPSTSNDTKNLQSYECEHTLFKKHVFEGVAVFLLLYIAINRAMVGPIVP